MSSAQEALEKVIAPGTVPASQTNLPVSKIVKMNEHGSTDYRMDIVVGKVVVAAAVSAKLQDSSGFQLWNDLTSTSITASTTKNIVSVDTTANSLQVTTHGYTNGQPVILNEASPASLPAPLVPNLVYYVKVVDANNIQLTEAPNSNQPIDLTSAGTGTNQVTAARVFTVKVSQVDAGSAAFIPLRNSLRLVVTTGVGDSLQIAQILSIQ